MKALGSILLIQALFISYPLEDSWEMFARVKFNPKFFKEDNEYFLVPAFNSEIKAHEGKEIILTGYYLPYDLPDASSVVISKYPYSACFFCGRAGPESVAEVVFTSRKPKFKLDQFITVKGKLKLNDTDVDHMTFILRMQRLSPNDMRGLACLRIALSRLLLYAVFWNQEKL